jgi:hypothetical protein
MRFPLAVLVLSLGLIGGCGQGSTENTSTETAAPPPSSVPSPVVAGVPAWATELRQGEAQLGQTIEQGRLGEVHDQAVRLQGMLQQVVAQAGTLDATQQQTLQEHTTAADRLVDELHDAGDSGDLTTTRTKFQEFQTHLRAIESVFGVPAP